MINKIITLFKNIFGIKAPEIQKASPTTTIKRETILETAQRLVQAHKEEDPNMSIAMLSPHESIIRLIEATSCVSTDKTMDTMWTFKYRAFPEDNIYYESELVLLSTEEWENYKAGTIKLPDGWNPNLVQLM